MSTVLVVDDEPDIRELVRINLELDGHLVLLASDGVEAMEYAVGEHPDCIVLDVMMPEKDGWQVLEEIKASDDPAVAEIPIIMLTAKSDDIDRIRGGIEGAIRYLTKPFSPSELRAEVGRADRGDPEPQKRRRAQTAALEQLARLESGRNEPVEGERAPRPHITRLGGRPVPTEQAAAASPAIPPDKTATLSDKQRELLHMVSATATVSEAAERLAVSRSNVYASLRRIARKVDARSVPELILLVRGSGFHAGA